MIIKTLKEEGFWVNLFILHIHTIPTYRESTNSLIHRPCSSKFAYTHTHTHRDVMSLSIVKELVYVALEQQERMYQLLFCEVWSLTT